MDQERLPHEAGRQAPHHLHGVLVGADLDVPGIGPAGTGQLGEAGAEPEDEDLRLDRPLGGPG